MLKLKPNEAKIFFNVLEKLKNNDVVTESQCNNIKHSIAITSFDWKKLARYCFWFAVASFIMSISAILTDHKLLKLIEKIFNAPYMVRFGFSAFISGILYYWGYKRYKQKPHFIYTNNAIMLLGVIFTAIGVANLGAAIDNGSGHFSLLILLSCLIYFVVGLITRSASVWLFAIFSFGSWFGAETGYASGWGAYYLGMNYPFRFFLLGLLMIVSVYFMEKNKYLQIFAKTTLIMALLYTFISLWLMSIWGNNSSIDSFNKYYESALYSLLFGLVAIVSILHGIKYDSKLTRGFGITFLFINFYTRYFEYFFNAMHKAIFFAILGFSLWYIGVKAEKIWLFKNKEENNMQNDKTNS